MENDASSKKIRVFQRKVQKEFDYVFYEIEGIFMIVKQGNPRF